MSTRSGSYGIPFPNRKWLAYSKEATIDPDREIVDAHHHLWCEPYRYLLDEFLEDADCGHNIRATVYVDCYAMYRSSGPQEFRSVGEIEFANGVAAICESQTYCKSHVAAAIVGGLDLRMGDRVKPALEAMMQVSHRFRGIRQTAAYDEQIRPSGIQHLFLDHEFRRGFQMLQKMGLTFDAWLYHTQLPELISLMRDFPTARVAINHLGGRLAVERFSGAAKDAVFESWRATLRELAHFPNVYLKLGGLGMRLSGFQFHERPEPPSSDDLSAAWQPYVQAAVDIFDPSRCMFESNFPVDKMSCSYGTLWNAFKKIASIYSDGEKAKLFSLSARDFYRLDSP